MKPKALLFDFDYTLADSSTGIIECVNYALMELALPPASDDAIRSTIGLSLPAIHAQLSGRQDPAQAEVFREAFIRRADAVMAANTVLLDGTRETVERLWREGFTLGIVTTKFRYRIEAILKRERLREPFAVIVGAEEVAAHKPHPESLLLALDRLQFHPADTLYVGDNLVDAEAARRAGVPFIGVLSGTTSRQAFSAHGVEQVISSVTELPREVQLKSVKCN